ncbi:hypothetical protein NDU88_006037 [Pleurodeles waltl]|uniref:Uncharacterized protein n=1 Tax=Pleurodeles waltl TaxID=8319 RepID=A0AAV7SNH9_PLEWA|nr:hypothetical protein NDU88_006037 [Pleurodeles waltl]
MVEDDLALLKRQVSTLRSSMADLQERVEDSENRAQRNNLRLVGLPEALDALDRWWRLRSGSEPGWRQENRPPTLL